MSVILACQCGQRSAAPDAAIGKYARCPRCGTKILVPMPSPGVDPALQQLFDAIDRSEQRTASSSFQNAQPHQVLTIDSAGLGLKSCPYCAEQIAAAAIKCRFCGSDLSSMPTSLSARKSSRARSRPLVLRLMVLATVIWPLTMVGVAMLSYAAHTDAILGDDGNMAIIGNSVGGYSVAPSVDYHAMGMAEAFFAGLVLPTMLYLPAMLVLFVIWFVQRQSRA